MKETVNQIISDSLEQTPEDTINGDKWLIEDLQTKPIEILEIFLTLQAVFDIHIEKEDAPKLKKVADIYDYIKKHATKNRLSNCADRLSEMTFVKIFPGMAYKIGIISHETILFLETIIGFKVRQGIDFTGIEISGLYLMQHLEEGCQANCAFCVQSEESMGTRKKSTLVDNKLMRFPTNVLKDTIHHAKKNGVKRICVQTVYNKNTVTNLLSLVKFLRSISDIPITACCIPISRSSLKALKKAGLDMIFINYETATPELFTQIRGKGRKGPYRWEKTTEAINDALEVFGKYKVGSHLQIGFGESPQDALALIQTMEDKKGKVSLIAFRPVPGTFMQDHERCTYASFHAIQLGSYLIQHKINRLNDFEFDADGNIKNFGLPESELKKIIQSGSPFRNRGGCPGCNRVYYETNPGERFYSYPRNLLPEELELIEQEILETTSEPLSKEQLKIA